VASRGSGVWPSRLAPESHGICGDPVQGKQNPPSFADEPYLVSTEPQRTYHAGQVVEFQVGVATHHMGHYEFRICNRPLDTEHFGSAGEAQACLDSWLLERATPDASCVANDPRADCQPIDEKHPERWYLPPPTSMETQVAGATFSDSEASPLPAVTELHSMRYKIPVGLTCERCTLQWYWSTGNTCFYDKDYWRYFQNMKLLGWNAEAWAPHVFQPWATEANTVCGAHKFPEEFFNCADISVLAASSLSQTKQRQHLRLRRSAHAVMEKDRHMAVRGMGLVQKGSTLGRRPADASDLEDEVAWTPEDLDMAIEGEL